MAVDPTSQFLFVSALEKQALHVYTIGTPGTTLLTEVASSPATTESSPYGVAVSPLGTAAGGVVFVAESGVGRVGSFSYDNLGNLTELAKYGSPWPSGLGSEGLAVDPTGKYLYVANYLDGSSPRSRSARRPIDGNRHGKFSGFHRQSQQRPESWSHRCESGPHGSLRLCRELSDDSISMFSTSAGMLTLMQTYATGTGPVALAID